MTPIVPAARLAQNPLAQAIRTGTVSVDHLAPLADHLDALVASNAASAEVMARRHCGTELAEFYALNCESETQAHALLKPFVELFYLDGTTEPPYDPLAMAYPGHIARLAITGTMWHHPVALLHMVRASVGSYQELRQALAETGRFNDGQLAHFTYFSHVEDEEIAATGSLVAQAPANVRARAIAEARQLAVCEELFWDRMVALCTPSATP